MLADGKASTGAHGYKKPPGVPHLRAVSETGVWLESGGRDLIKFDSTDNIQRRRYRIVRVFYSTSPCSWSESATMPAAAPLRRELFSPGSGWSQGRGRAARNVYRAGFHHQVLINAIITATRDGELFLFVNDAVIGIPGFNDDLNKFFDRTTKGRPG